MPLTPFEYHKQGFLKPFEETVLFSHSPRRQELLSFLEPQIASLEVDERGIQDQIMASCANDSFLVTVCKVCCELAAAKAGLPLTMPSDAHALSPFDPPSTLPSDAHALSPSDLPSVLPSGADCTPPPKTLYISADTAVVFHEEILNKPKTKAEAEQMFRSYLGHSHEVVTAVCLRMDSGFELFACTTTVHFAPWSPPLERPIQAYLASSKPMDKAGAYGIQELDPRLIMGIEGDINTVIGFPVAECFRRISPFCPPALNK